MTTTHDQIAAARSLPAGAPPLPALAVGPLLAEGVRRHGHAPLLTFYDDATGERTELSWATFENWVAKTANLLVEELEVGRGDRVATVLGSSWTTAVITVACWRVGATLVPADADGPFAEIRALLGIRGIRVLFCREDRLGDLPDLLPDRAVDVVAVGTGLGGRATTDVGAALPYAEEVLAFGDHVDVPEAGPADLALLVWSATAGAPARLTQEALVAAGSVLAGWGVDADDRLLVTRPLQGVDSLGVALVGALATGASLVLARMMPPATVLRRVRDERITLAVPTAADLDSLDAASGAAAPDGFRGFLAPAGAPDAVVRAAIGRGWRVAVGHGVTEAACASSLVPADLDAATARWLADAEAPTIGTATSQAQVAVFDAGGLVPHGTRGQVRLRGPVLASGYDGRDDLDRAFAGGWFATGDGGYCAVGPDGREYVFLTGRA